MTEGRRRAAIVLAAIVSACALLAPVFLAGVPAYVHDWAWPPDRAGLQTHLFEGWQAWLDEGIGEPNAFPTALPHYVVLGWLAAIVPSRAVLALLLGGTFTLAFLSAFAFARRVVRLRAGALACAALYAASPLALTELVAGHLSYLQAYAAFPVFALALRECARNRQWAGIGAIAFAVTVVQPQFLGFDCVYALAMLATGAVRPAGVRKAALFAVPLSLPALYGPTLNALGEAGVFVHQHAVLAWEVQQSVPPLAALEGLGYFTGYVEGLFAVPFATWLMLIPVLCALYASVRFRASRDVRGLAACAALGWLLVTGLDGPLAAPDAWTFEHVAAASLFRELFNFMVLVWFPVCVLGALALESLPKPLAALATLAVALALAPPWAAYGRYLGAAPSAGDIASVATVVRRDPRWTPSPGRVVWWPALQPIGPPQRDRGGTDPLHETPVAGLVPLYEYQPHATFGTAVAFATAGKWDAAARLFGWLGVRYVVARDGIASFAGAEPDASPVRSGPDLSPIGATRGYTIFRVGDARPLIDIEPGVRSSDAIANPFPASRRDAEPSGDAIVAAFPYLFRAPAVADCGDDAVLAPATRFARTNVAWLLAAPLHGERCSWMPLRALRAAGRAPYVAAGWAVRPLPRGTLPDAPLARPVTLERAPDAARARLQARTSGLLVSRNAFDARWRALVDGRDAGVAREWNGFAAWPISAGTHAIEVRYAGDAAVRFVLCVQAFVLLFAFALALAPDPRRAKDDVVVASSGVSDECEPESSQRPLRLRKTPL